MIINKLTVLFRKNHDATIAIETHSHIFPILLTIGFPGGADGFVPQANGRPQMKLKFAKNAQSEPVALELYYESLCPYCQDFIKTQLTPTWDTLRDTGIFTFKMFPYGNAYTTDDDGDGIWEFDCQHGNEECRGNIWEICLIDRYFFVSSC